MPVMSLYQNNKALLRYILLLVGACFVLFLAIKSWSEISASLVHIKLEPFIISIVIGIFGNLVQAIYFNKMLEKHGAKISNSVAIKIFMAGQIAKYIPGKIWGIAYQMSHVTGKSGATAVVLANVEMMFSFLFMTTMIAVSLAALYLSPFAAIAPFLAGLIGFLYFYRTNVINLTVERIVHSLKALNFAEGISSGETRVKDGLSVYILFSLAYVLSNMLMLNAVFDFSYSQASVYIVLLSIAWVVGVFAFIVPAGMGVREVVFVTISSYMLSEYSIETLASIVVVSRLWQIIQEFLGLLISSMIRNQ